MREPFPFSAVAGAAWSKRALLLVAVDPELKGVLIAGGPGTAKSLLARSFFPLAGAAVAAPCTVTVDALTGGLDLERTLVSGRRIAAEGLLERARGGFLFVDEVNRLDRAPAAIVAAAISSFAVVGTYDPAGGPVHSALADAVGLHVAQDPLTACERVELLKRMSESDQYAKEFARQTAELETRIRTAKERLPLIELRGESRIRLGQAAEELGVEGHRADVFAVRAARASAALDGRTSVEDGDLETAVRLVLTPRGRDFKNAQAEACAAAAQAQACAEDVVLSPLDATLPDDVFRVEARNSQRGRVVRTVAKRGNRVAIEATLRAAAPHQLARKATGIRVEPGDLRYKECRRKKGALIIFALDASGSMARNRVQQAKGAILGLLGKAYVHRDKVALVSFRDRRADIVLGPTGSVALARRAIDALPVGGTTPLAAGLLEALKLARREKRKENRKSLLVLLTDGSPNVACGAESIWKELGDICAAVRAEGLASTVVDTRRGFETPGGAQLLASMLGARHVRLGAVGR